MAQSIALGIDTAYRWQGSYRLSKRYGSVGECMKQILHLLADGFGGLHHLLELG